MVFQGPPWTQVLNLLLSHIARIGIAQFINEACGNGGREGSIPGESEALRSEIQGRTGRGVRQALRNGILGRIAIIKSIGVGLLSREDPSIRIQSIPLEGLREVRRR